MRNHKFIYFAREGASNMFRHGFMSFAAIGVTVACLLIMGTFTMVAMNINASLEDLEQRNQLLAFVDESLDDSSAAALGDAIRKVDNVSGATFITREEAREAFEQRHNGETEFQDLELSIFRHRYAVDLQDIGHMRETREALKNVPGVVEVNGYEKETDTFIALRNIASIVGVGLIAVLFLESVFIIANTIKLTTFDRRDEIAIMKMVGATNGFIRWPFVYEGFLLGAVSAVVAFFLQWGLYTLVTRALSMSTVVQFMAMVPFSVLWPYVALIFLGAGLVIGVGGSLSAIRKFLQV